MPFHLSWHPLHFTAVLASVLVSWLILDKLSSVHMHIFFIDCAENGKTDSVTLVPDQPDCTRVYLKHVWTALQGHT